MPDDRDSRIEQQVRSLIFETRSALSRKNGQLKNGKPVGQSLDDLEDTIDKVTRQIAANTRDMERSTAAINAISARLNRPGASIDAAVDEYKSAIEYCTYRHRLRTVKHDVSREWAPTEEPRDA